MANKIIDFNKFWEERTTARATELDKLAAEVDAMDMNAAVQYMLGIKGGSKEAMQHCLDTMERVHGANLKIRE